MRPNPIILVASLLAAACSDPVHDADVDALGGEAAGVPKGPTHRPGQPCLTCHGGDGPASFVMSVAGTVYTHLSGRTPARNAVVRVLDANERTYETRTNEVGNFWVPAVEFEPAFPATAALTLTLGTITYPRVMQTTMRLDGSCNGCHSGPQRASSPGQLFVLPDSVNP